MSDPVFDLPRERELASPGHPSSLGLLRRPDFRLLFCAVATSEVARRPRQPASCSWRPSLPSPRSRPLFAVAACATATVGLAGALLATRLVEAALPERAE